MRAESDRWTGRLRGQAGAWLAAALAMTLLAGCTVFAEDEPEPATIQVDTDESQFPNIGDVPDAAPATTTAEEREVIVEQLQADQASSGVVVTETSETEIEVVEPSTTEMVAVAETVAVMETVEVTSTSATAVNTQGFAYTSIQTPPPADSYATGTRIASTPNVIATTATPLPAPQPLASVTPNYGTETTPGGQVTVDYSVLGGGTQGATYGQTGYYGYGAAGEPVALIFFQHGSATLSSDDRNVIHDVAELQKARGGVIQIVGHASMRTGTVDPATHDEANFDMSLARANAVADALLREGVNPANVQVAAAGSTEPEYYEFIPTGEAGNRRAEIYLTY